MTYFFWTYLARFIGILLIIPALFPSWFVNWFPGLEDRRIVWILFAIGVVIFAVAAIVFQICRKMERSKKDMGAMEELK